MHAFITGSRAYGTPNAKSDVDLVIRVDENTADILRKLSDKTMEVAQKGTKTPVRFGNLNLILCETDDEWAVWRVGTTHMTHDVVTYDRIKAKAELDKLRSLVGIFDKADSERK